MNMNKLTYKFERPAPPCVKLWLKGFTQLQVVTDVNLEILEVNIIQFYLKQGRGHHVNTKVYRKYKVF